MKSCIALAGPTTTVTKVGVSACASVTDSESKKVSEMRTTDKIIIRRASKETRSQRIYDRSKELVQQLINIQHIFRATWKDLQSRFPSEFPNYCYNNV